MGNSKVMNSYSAPTYAPPPGPPPSTASHVPHTNAVIEAGHVRARDEQQMQNLLQNAQFQARIYNTEIEPEHDTDWYCTCATHVYTRAKMSRLGVHDMWSTAVKYPGMRDKGYSALKEFANSSDIGEKTYNNVYNNNSLSIMSRNPYNLRVVSPYGPYGGYTSRQFLDAKYHQRSVEQTIALDRQFNAQAQSAIDAVEPRDNIWETGIEGSFARMSLPAGGYQDEKRSAGIGTVNGNGNAVDNSAVQKNKRFSGFKKSLGILPPEEKALNRAKKAVQSNDQLKNSILQEEAGRWPDEQWRAITTAYAVKTGMTRKIGELRQHQPIQYLHLLRAGYFEPIPVAWATMLGNPLKFSIESAGGWRGITPAWRGYEDTAEERLYWVLNHREGSIGARLKPDFITTMTMARDRMASAVEPPPQYFSPGDTCHVQHTTNGYSKQVMPRPFRAFDAPEVPSDDTMIMLDVSGSMDFDPLRPVYKQYLITGYEPSTQPKNKDVAKAIVRRFADAMAHHDHMKAGYDLVTFSSQAEYIGRVNHQNLDEMWRKVRIGGGTRVMTGWQKVKDLHFKKHSESATWHPVYGWQAGPQTPMLRLLLLLDGEATDMDEFELDLLGLSWAHVTIFLIGVDGCPHHHRHANELTRISDVNHHVSFVDAQGNTPERFVTHELLKRHLGQDISMQEFELMEELPAYS